MQGNGIFRGMVRSVFWLLLHLLGLLVFFAFCFQNYQVPSGSMIPTLQEGDIVLVSKMHYGARIPMTPLHVPLTEKKIWWTNWPSYSELIKLPYEEKDKTSH